MILGSQLGVATGSPIRAIQHDLAAVGISVRLTGQLDKATVDGVNKVLGEFDDPGIDPRLCTGNLSMHDIARNIRHVREAVHKVVGGVMTVAAG